MTQEQEQEVLEMLAAFKAGKRLSDLPSVSGDNPFDLLVEVLESGESKKAYLAEMLPYLEEDVSYGIEFDVTVSSPACTRIGNLSLHRSLPVQSRMRGCLLNDDGEVVEYLNPTDWGGDILDGSRGQVMVEIPDYYRKFETSGNKRRVRFSEYPLPGYTHVKTKYISAYEASLDRTNNKLCSIVNMDTQYRGGNNTSEWDGTYRSLLGRPVTNISRTNFRTYARNRKSGSTNWNCMTYDLQKDLYWLFVVEYATLNSQAAYNAELTQDGYHQGGLGAGVTNIANWGTYNSSNPFVPCGVTNSLGDFSGVVTYNAMASDGETVYYEAPVPRYRGVENPFGHIWQWTDGINVQITPAAGDNLSRVYVTDNPANFNDANYDGYHHVGNEARTEGYVTAIIFGEEGDIMPSAVGGGDSTYFCDYHYTNIPTSTTLRGVRFGGIAGGGSKAGFAYAHSTNAPSDSYADIGSRLCFIPAS